jgi:pimeloyl-ACP methyl ester carboxylesterase
VAKVNVPTLIIHGDSDAIVPFEVSGRRSHEAIEGSSLILIEGGPHAINATHAEQFNRALLDFLG